MKITAQEENGLRILLQIALDNKNDGSTIPDISEKVGLTQHNVAKLCRVMRLANFITSTRGHTGGYMLARNADKIELSEVLTVLGGRLYDDAFCESRAGVNACCTLDTNCSVRSLWQIVQNAVDTAIRNMTLDDLVNLRVSTFEKMPVLHQLETSTKS
ncbi:MAG: Rrf2 family transcriptional regulator [Calditrichaeota bacterium]|nr:MAG: Rrf2 family transcriptional regulator [Calditrichota bacterium]